MKSSLGGEQYDGYGWYFILYNASIPLFYILVVLNLNVSLLPGDAGQIRNLLEVNR